MTYMDIGMENICIDTYTQPLFEPVAIYSGWLGCGAMHSNSVSMDDPLLLLLFRIMFENEMKRYENTEGNWVEVYYLLFHYFEYRFGGIRSNIPKFEIRTRTGRGNSIRRDESHGINRIGIRILCSCR